MPDKIRNSQVRVVALLNVSNPRESAMLQAKIRITAVRMAVARLESIPLTPALASTAVRPANKAESNAQWSQVMALFSKNRAHNTALYAQCRAIGRGRKGAGHEHNH